MYTHTYICSVSLMCLRVGQNVNAVRIFKNSFAFFITATSSFFYFFSLKFLFVSAFHNVIPGSLQALAQDTAKTIRHGRNSDAYAHRSSGA